jgi:hypothetical protein
MRTLPFRVTSSLDASGPRVQRSNEKSPLVVANRAEWAERKVDERVKLKSVNPPTLLKRKRGAPSAGRGTVEANATVTGCEATAEAI